MNSIIEIILICLGSLIGLILILSLCSHLIIKGKTKRNKKNLEFRYKRNSFIVKELQDDISYYIFIVKDKNNGEQYWNCIVGNILREKINYKKHKRNNRYGTFFK